MAISKMVGGIIILAAFILAGKANSIEVEKVIVKDQIVQMPWASFEK